MLQLVRLDAIQRANLPIIVCIKDGALTKKRTWYALRDSRFKKGDNVAVIAALNNSDYQHELNQFLKVKLKDKVVTPLWIKHRGDGVYFENKVVITANSIYKVDINENKLMQENGIVQIENFEDTSWESMNDTLKTFFEYIASLIQKKLVVA